MPLVDIPKLFIQQALHLFVLLPVHTMTEEASLTSRIAAIAPAAIALRSSGRTLTYDALNRAANQLAQHLATLGVTRGTTVALCLDRSFDQIISALAIMRAGAAFVPIDPEWPEERIRHVVADSGARVLIALATLSRRIDTSAQPFDPSTWTPQPTSSAERFIAPPQQPSDLAYIIYTSGSTGVPKGVEITRANLDHLIAWHLKAFQVTADDRATHLAGLGFDAAIWEIWPYLAVGASIALADPISRNDPALLQQWLLSERITISFVPTPLAEPLITMPWPAEAALRILLTGGDTLHTAPAPHLPFTLFNNYGPTECTVVATSGPVPSATTGLPPIGKGIEGTSIYLLDEQQQPVPPGVTGELYIGGPGVGAGYRNLPDQTSQSFLPDSFAVTPKARMFRTGDMASLRPDGQLSFLGRRDTQEKIRGFRIELDEIVCVLNRHPAVTFCTVAVRTSPQAGKTLVAYLVPAEGATLSPRELQEFAARSLPDYMVPSAFVRFAAIPLTANGKVDTRSLPEPTEQNLLQEPASREPQTEAETILLDIVRALLHTNAIGVEDDFFLAGGHSLLGTQVVLRARETFGVLLTLRDLFEAPTVALLASRIEALLIEQLDAMTDEEAMQLTAVSPDEEKTA